MFEGKYFNYGVIKVDNGTARVYCGMYDYRIIARCCHISEAYWSGRSIIIKEEGVKDRMYRYYDWDKYDVVLL